MRKPRLREPKAYISWSATHLISPWPWTRGNHSPQGLSPTTKEDLGEVLFFHPEHPTWTSLWEPTGASLPGSWLPLASKIYLIPCWPEVLLPWTMDQVTGMGSFLMSPMVPSLVVEASLPHCSLLLRWASWLCDLNPRWQLPRNWIWGFHLSRFWLAWIKLELVILRLILDDKRAPNTYGK